jgi:hypothetical protein
MNAVLLVLVLPFGFFHDAERLPSQYHWQYRFGCTPANRHCERCRQDECGGPCYDYRRNFNYFWDPPYHRPILDETPPDISPRIIPLDHPSLEELPAPKPTLPEETSPSDKAKKRS